MERIATLKCIELAMKSMGKSVITIPELNTWADDYVKKNPSSYPEITKRDILAEHPHNIWYYNNDDGVDIIYLQENIFCPFCGEEIKKYPDIDRYEKTIKNHNFIVNTANSMAKRMGILNVNVNETKN